ncbi:MAG: replication factor C large subunit, partial [Thermoplasmatales archaeon A-plasma]
DDLRAIINDAVSMMAYRDDPEAVGQPSIRDAPSGIYDVMHATFKEGDYEGILRDLMDKDFTTEDYLMWLDKNLPMEAKDAADLDHAYDILSIADVFVGRVIKKQHYAYKGYAEEIAAGVSTGIAHHNEKYVKYEFPSYIMKMSRLRDSREGRKFATAKLARFTHSGRMRISGNLWFYGEMLKRKEFSAMLEKQLNLSEKELSVLKKG